MDKLFNAHNVDDRSFVAFIKRQIHNELTESNFEKSRIHEIDIIVSELTSNLIKHADAGEMLYRLVNEEKHSSFELITIDQGPGMNDVQRMMKDGVSTTNTLGHGLGSIQRLSDEFQVFSVPKWGTVTYTLITTKKKKNGASPLEVKAIRVPKPSETVCGDGYMVTNSGEYTRVFFADGLGHGQNAFDAVALAADYFASSTEIHPVEIVRQMHTHVRKTRGLVATVAVLNSKTKEWRICGVGNISTRLYEGIAFKHYIAYNGIIGMNIPTSLNESVIPAERNQQLIMCSDGLRSRWDLTKYTSILKYDPMVLAASLYKDYNRRNDDSSVFIGKVNFER